MQTMIWKAPAFGSLKINCDAAVVEKEVCVAAVVKVIKIPIRILKSYDFTIQYYESDSNFN